MKALPYGISDFPRIRCEDYYYVDKSRFIEMLERQPPYLFLIRPRRFGKSLFLAMLEAYYSIDYAGRFEELFGELYIGQSGITATWFCDSISLQSVRSWRMWSVRSASIAAW